MGFEFLGFSDDDNNPLSDHFKFCPCCGGEIELVNKCEGCNDDCLVCGEEE